MKNMAVTAVYPAGRFDSALMVQDGNRQMFELLGEYLYSPLYKMVSEKDINRLEAVLESCGEDESTDECVQLKNPQGGYDKYILSVRRCSGTGEYYIELQNVSVSRQQMKSLKDQLSAANDFLTVAGGYFFTYHPRTNNFCMFWANYEQKIYVYDTDLDEWEKKMMNDGLVEAQDGVIFNALCESLRSGEHSQTFSFHGKVLTKGGNKDAYRVKLLPRTYEEEKIVVGAWSIVNEQTGNVIDDYVEGSFVDSLTKILNKRAITEYAEEAVAAGEKVAIVMIDIDNFKDVNDTYGHMFGDQVIAATADIAKKVVGENGAVGRMGGDEFMVVLKRYEDELDLRNYLRGIKTSVASLFQEKLGGNRLSCSIGAARAGIGADDYKGLFRIADKALYIAKQKGRNRFIIYKPELHGQFNVSGNDYDMMEIRDSFYSDKDLNKLNKLLADVVLNGSSSLPGLLKHAAHTLMLGRLVVIGRDSRSVIAAYPDDCMEIEGSLEALDREQYLEQFEDDLLVITNINKLEFSMPEVYAVYHKNKVLSLMQHLLRDREGRCIGVVTAEECVNMRHFPKLAMQLFENMCRVVNAVLIKEGLDK